MARDDARRRPAERYHCLKCGRDMDLAEWALSGVCGECVKKSHRVAIMGVVVLILVVGCFICAILHVNGVNTGGVGEVSVAVIGGIIILSVSYAILKWLLWFIAVGFWEGRFRREDYEWGKGIWPVIRKDKYDD
jgi:hypothetical protein